ITPTAPSLPPKISEAIVDPIKLYLSDIYTSTVNLIGLPAISIPADIVNGLPVGIQLIGPKLGEGLLINIAYIHEVKSGLKNLIPTVVSPYV
ncbi:MAG: amidase family protein, partial [Sulfolobales archaeon]